MAKPTNTETKIQLEDLLRFKKHECPDEAFWASFDEKLHQKTLQALVKPHSIWLRIFSQLKTVFHPAFAMPSAAAIALFVFLFTATQPTQDEINASVQLAASNTETIEFVATSDINTRLGTQISVVSSGSSDTIPLVELVQRANNIRTAFAANTIEMEAPQGQNFTKLRAAQSLLSGNDGVQYVASTYTTGSNAYATMPMNAVY